jgi:error-prone DNA polymerase
MRYVELHCKSNFTFLEGASHPDELVQQAESLGYQGLALTDRETVAGVVRGFTPAKELNFKYIVGTEICPTDAPPIVLWPTDRAAYGRMCRLISRGRLRAEKGDCELCFDDIAELSDGLIAGLVSAPPVGRDSPDDGSDAFVRFSKDRFRETFGDRAYLLCHLHRGVDDSLAIDRLQQWSVQAGVPLVAAGNVCYHIPERMLMHDTVTAIRNGSTIDSQDQARLANSQYHLRSLSEIAGMYRKIPDAIARTIEIANRCEFSLDQLRYEYPAEMAPHGVSLIDHLRRLTWEGAKQRWPGGLPDKVLQQIRHEIKLIKELNYEAYFLTVWDMVRFARERNILCQGRGSAANSAVCYCLGITSVDPSQTDLLFERFVSRERGEAPDIDVDFEHQRREEVLQYLYQKYGRDHAGMTAVVTTYRTRSAVREVGKAMGVSGDCIETIAKVGSDAGEFPDQCQHAGLDPQSPMGQRFVYLVQTLVGFPRHLSQHTGGMVMTAGNLCELCPIENASMEDRTVIQWNKDDLDELGILKVDVLSLGMLSALRRCFDLVAEHHGRSLSLSTIPQDDTDTYDMICRADTVGVFQIESRAQMSMLPRLRPRCYYDLVIEVSIVRPGPIQGNMVHPFLKARENPDAVVYPNEAIKKVLSKTLGVPIFQEQAMRLAVVAAGFTPGEADQLRRAMAAWRRPGVIDKFRIKLMEGMNKQGLRGEFAEQVFNQIRGFGEYGFPESHAASFALLVYASCYLKCHYPAAFCVALLNSQPMGFYAPAQLIDDAKKHGVRIRGVDVNHSDWESTLEPDPNRATERSPGSGVAIRMGLHSIRGLPQRIADDLVHARDQGGPFESLKSMTARCNLSKSSLAMFADADALGSLSEDRRAAIWHSLGQDEKPGSQPLFGDVDDNEVTPEELVSMTPMEEVQADYRMTGLSLKAHPISFAREKLKQLDCVTASQLPKMRDGRHVRVAGLVLMRQRPSTAKGITFVTIEDETGSMNLVLFPKVWQRFFSIARTSNAWLVEGKLENRKGIIHVIVGRVEALNDSVSAAVPNKSRDFH